MVHMRAKVLLAGLILAEMTTTPQLKWSPSFQGYMRLRGNVGEPNGKEHGKCNGHWD